MAKRSNPKLIGSFVVGAIALVILGILAFGGGRFLAPKRTAVLFFEGSLSGLDVGSPVTFRGVRIGAVTKIVIQYDIKDQKLQIPVFIQINPDRLQIVRGERSDTNLAALVDRGLRAQLQVQSLVTGQTSVDFNFYPGTPVNRVGLEPDVEELPTIPSSIDLLKANITSLLVRIQNLPLQEIADGLVQVVDSADLLLQQTQTLVSQASSLLAYLKTEVTPLTKSVVGATTGASQLVQEAQKRLALQPGEPLQNLNLTLLAAQKLVDGLNRDVPRLIGPAAQALAKTGTALDQATLLLQAAQRLVSPGSPIYYELTTTLNELNAAARAIKVFAEYIQRNPNALLLGNRQR